MPKEFWNNHHFRRGFSLVEVLLSSLLFAILVTVLFGAVLYGAQGNAGAGSRVRALLLAEEGLEVMRDLREATSTNIVNGTFGLAVSSSKWIASGTQDITGAFVRQIIVSSTDPQRKNVTAQVDWQEGVARNGTVSITTRLTDWHTNPWGVPSRQASVDATGTHNSSKIQVQGDFVYLVRDTGTPNFMIFDISNPAAPSSQGTLTLLGNLTNIAVSGNFAYVTSDDNTAEFQVVDVTNPAAPFLADTLDLVGGANANSVFVVGTKAYVVRSSSANPDFAVIDISVPATSTVSGTLELGAGGFGVWAATSTAYVASDSNTQELQVIDVTNPAAPNQIGSADLTGTVDGTTIFGTSGFVLVGQGTNVHKISIVNPGSPNLLGTFAAGGTVNDVVIAQDAIHAFLATANAAAEFQVIDVSTTSTPILIGSANLSATVNGVTYDEPPKDRAYLAGTSNTDELMVMRP